MISPVASSSSLPEDGRCGVNSGSFRGADDEDDDEDDGDLWVGISLSCLIMCGEKQRGGSASAQGEKTTPEDTEAADGGCLNQKLCI